jgi:hypothetical protein
MNLQKSLVGFNDFIDNNIIGGIQGTLNMTRLELDKQK